MTTSAGLDAAAPRRELDAVRERTLDVLAAQLEAKGIAFERPDLEDFHDGAWHALYVSLAQGRAVGDLFALLVAAGRSRAVDEFRRARAGGGGAGRESAQSAAAAVRTFVAQIADRLGERERRAAALAHLHGMDRSRAAAFLGLDPTGMETVAARLDAALGPIAAVLASGAWCAEHDKLIKGYALGLHDPDGESYRQALEHLDGCAGCRHRVLGLRALTVAIAPLHLPWEAVGTSAETVVGGALLSSVAAAPPNVPAAAPASTVPSAPAARGRLAPKRRALAGLAGIAVVLVVGAALLSGGVEAGGRSTRRSPRRRRRRSPRRPRRGRRRPRPLTRRRPPPSAARRAPPGWHASAGSARRRRRRVPAAAPRPPRRCSRRRRPPRRPRPPRPRRPSRPPPRPRRQLRLPPRPPSRRSTRTPARSSAAESVQLSSTSSASAAKTCRPSRSEISSHTRTPRTLLP